MMRIIFFLLTLVILSPAFAARPQANMATPVETIILEKRAFSNMIKASGALKSTTSTPIASEISGKVKAILFKDGHEVQAGQMLLQLDDDIAKANLKAAKANLKLTELKLQRIAELFNKNVLSKEHYDEAVAANDQAIANTKAAQENLDKTQIKAPFSGTLGLSKINIGEVIQTGQKIIEIQHSNKLLEVEFALAEHYHNIVKGTEDIIASSDIYPSVNFPGKIYTQDASIDTDTFSISYKAKIDNIEAKLKPGNFVYLDIILPKRDVLMVPEYAVMKTAKGDMVFLVEDEQAKIRPVTTGDRDRHGNIEITSGLKEKDQIVTSGHMKLYDGASVMISNNIASSEN